MHSVLCTLQCNQMSRWQYFVVNSMSEDSLFVMIDLGASVSNVLQCSLTQNAAAAEKLAK